MRRIATTIACLTVATVSGCSSPAPHPPSYYTPTPAPPPQPQKEPGTPVNLSAQQQQMVRADTTNKLKDPESARFGKMYATKDKDGDLTVCGFVNAKNSYGGYTGMKPFIGMILGSGKPGGFKLVKIGSSDNEQLAVASVCRDAGISLAE